MNGRAKLILIPGLGMDGRMFELQRGEVGAKVVVPGWIRPVREEKLEAYARRMAEGIERREDERVYLGGVSIGGAIALEMSRYVEAEGVILIASATSCKAIPNLLRSLGKVAPWVPAFVLRPFVRMAPLVVRLLMRDYPLLGRS